MTGKPALAAHGVTHAGNVRSKNEDCFLADDELGLFMVLDGMGGHNAGDVASALARDVIREKLRGQRGRVPPAAALEAAVRAASAAVHTRAQQDRDLTGMGTTVVACCLAGERRALVAHVGDSRAYVLRRGRLRLLTRDHTVVAELLARGALTGSQAAVHPYKSVLSRNLGGRRDARVDMTDVELEPGDRILLCSDGLSGFASHEAMEQVMAGAEDAAHASAELVDLALRGGGGDNVTALVIEFGAELSLDSTRERRRSAASAWWARRELFEVEGEGALRPLLASLDRGRVRHMRAARELSEAPSIRVAALRRLAGVHEGLMSALALLVVESGQEVSERHVRATAASTRRRADMARQEARITRLERELGAATAADMGLATIPDGRPEPEARPAARTGEDGES